MLRLMNDRGTKIQVMKQRDLSDKWQGVNLDAGLVVAIQRMVEQDEQRALASWPTGADLGTQTVEKLVELGHQVHADRSMNFVLREIGGSAAAGATVVADVCSTDKSRDPFFSSALSGESLRNALLAYGILVAMGRMEPCVGLKFFRDSTGASRFGLWSGRMVELRFDPIEVLQVAIELRQMYAGSTART